jgi:hypothetical protein
VKGLKLEGNEAPKRAEAAFLAYDDDLGRFGNGLPSPQPFLVGLQVKSREYGLIRYCSNCVDEHYEELL